jgi:post-segregation antitoxin (ccd killing protein)
MLIHINLTRSIDITMNYSINLSCLNMEEINENNQRGQYERWSSKNDFSG